MANDRVRVRARIRFLTTEEGGRATPLSGGGSYRPNHAFSTDGVLYMGFVDLAVGREVRPGDTIETEVSLFTYPEIEGAIAAGREWRIQEGNRLVGLGTILEVLGPGD